MNQGKSADDILAMKELKMPEIEFIDNKSYKLYFLLSNMPSGLPDCFLQLIFNDYSDIKYDTNIITKSKNNNWNIIIKDKNFYENFKEFKDIKSCYESLFKTLQLYTILLNEFIETNKSKINYKDGNFHYIYNSYSNKEIWKCNIKNIFGELFIKNKDNKDFKIHKHKENIINLISVVVKEFNIFYFSIMRL